MLLQNSLKFQEEYRKFKEGIGHLTDIRAKNQAQQLLKDLLTEVKKLDQVHQGLTFQQKLPEDIRMSRSKLTEIRKKLSNLIYN
jgi:16S rRNA C1402 N4-methylase RsmH